ncbi:hypothetical protein ACFGVR_14250 [Mucilaginibacter sp. AW1-3]
MQSLITKLKTACLIVFTAILLLTVACKKSANTPAISNGTYSGRFIYWTQGVVYLPTRSAVTLTFNGQNYNSSSGTNHYPAGGSGNYSVDSDSKITFRDINYWTANFDGNLILNGEYAYHYEGDSLVINKTINGLANYEYRIKKN